jgi:DNA-binding GntR family transcriptional regulator
MLMRDRIYQLIRQSILTCEFEPGQELREQVLAVRYQVSRSPVRDSLLRLEQENLVTVLPRQGYLITPISITDAEDIFGLRLVIEPACAAAASRQDDAAVQTLDRFRGYGYDFSDSAMFFEYNIALHDAVADLSGNARLAKVAHDLAQQFDRLVRIILRDDPTVKTDILVTQHDSIIDAIQAHDVDAAYKNSYDHVADARARIISLLGRGVGMRDLPPHGHP